MRWVNTCLNGRRLVAEHFYRVVLFRVPYDRCILLRGDLRSPTAGKPKTLRALLVKGLPKVG
jgi:hypothetical protein